MCSITHKVQITNYASSEIVYNSIVLIKGLVHDVCSADVITITNKNQRIISQSHVSRINGEFKLLVKLDLGSNDHLICYCNFVIDLTLHYQQRATNYVVQPIYIICKNHNGKFQTKDNLSNDIEIAQRKVVLAVELIQCLIAEKLYESGAGRKTFALNDTCKVFNSNLEISEAHKMQDVDLWNYISRELLKNFGCKLDSTKIVAVLSCTRFKGISDGNYSYENIRKHTMGDCSLGGGGLALFGSGCLYSWPIMVEKVITHFSNLKPIDLSVELDNSNYRRTYGGCYASSLGSLCHEIGHIFDLGHTENGIMGDSFDFINRFFTVGQKTDHIPPRKCSQLIRAELLTPLKCTQVKKSSILLDSYHKQKKDDMVHFSLNCILILANNKWFIDTGGLIDNKFRCDTGVISAETLPIRIIEVRIKLTGYLVKNFYFENQVFSFCVKDHIKDNAENIEIFVMDIKGNREIIAYN